MIEKRPLSSVVAVKLEGDAFGIFRGDGGAFDRVARFVFHEAADAPGLSRRAAGEQGDEERREHASRRKKRMTHAAKPPECA